MDSRHNSTDYLQEIVDRNQKVILTKNLHYFYPNGHLMTNQIRWLKVSLDRGLRSHIVA